MRTSTHSIPGQEEETLRHMDDPEGFGDPDMGEEWQEYRMGRDILAFLAAVGIANMLGSLYFRYFMALDTTGAQMIGLAAVQLLTVLAGAILCACTLSAVNVMVIAALPVYICDLARKAPAFPAGIRVMLAASVLTVLLYVLLRFRRIRKTQTSGEDFQQFLGTLMKIDVLRSASYLLLILLIITWSAMTCMEML